MTVHLAVLIGLVGTLGGLWWWADRTARTRGEGTG